jgi:hypothetical protein
MGLRVEPHVAGHKSAGLPQPEEVFLSWLMAQPEGADLAAAVDVEIGRLGRYAGRHPGPLKLAELFRNFRHCLDAKPRRSFATAGRVPGTSCAQSSPCRRR